MSSVLDNRDNGMSEPTDETLALKILGRRVIEVCTTCRGDGLIWDSDGESCWADRCATCNCIGYILDIPLDRTEDLEQEEIPF